ncbi:hypothetical protein D3C87_1569990 [compost metagenome]
MAHQLPVGGQALPFGSNQPPFRGQVGIRDHKIPVHGIVADNLQQEAFAAAEFTGDQLEGSSALCDVLHIPEDGLDLRSAANRDMLQTNTRHYSRRQ